MIGQRDAPATLSLGKNTCTHLIEGWAGPKEGLESRKVFAPSKIQTWDFPGRNLVAIMTTLYQLLFPNTAVVQSAKSTALILVTLPASEHVQGQFRTPHFFQIYVLQVVVLHLDV